MTVPSNAIIEVAYSQDAKNWNIAVFWPGQAHKMQEKHGPFGSLIQAREIAEGIALRLSEEGCHSPQIIVLAGALWGKVTTF